MKPTLVLLVLLPWICGCGSLVPKERREQVAVTTAGKIAADQSSQVSKQMENVLPPISVTSSGSSNQVSISIPPSRTIVVADNHSKQNAGSDDKLTTDLSVAVPMGVKLILIAVGLAGIVAVVWIIRRQSAAANAAWEYGDRLLADMINRKQAEAMASTDSGRLAALNAEIAGLEKERGKLNAE